MPLGSFSFPARDQIGVELSRVVNAAAPRRAGAAAPPAFVIAHLVAGLRPLRRLLFPNERFERYKQFSPICQIANDKAIRVLMTELNEFLVYLSRSIC